MNHLTRSQQYTKSQAFSNCADQGETDQNEPSYFYLHFLHS